MLTPEKPSRKGKVYEEWNNSLFYIPVVCELYASPIRQDGAFLYH
ncbi:hypothetical protein HMPREF0083_00728 [Aneurinibacillus aneurinilyticus ATCC 12856]|uniref:Uncharacterized protein n=1 Tax=Aneurinibacillus aneurinilyticus ATCC 12856 TaxID=649747 RepID=U1X877_ANEAE|nr:hypothetical protein HMPREF0083_00728 [Aneurinibacillus aneurinilyticus ATCC 12856]